MTRVATPRQSPRRERLNRAARRENKEEYSTMTPAELSAYLATLAHHALPLSVMIWGPPGIGKSSIVAQVATARGMGMLDLRLSQLAPTDLRGLPVAEGGVARWLPPEFLPRDGTGILFLDEINMAPPAMQGVAQQLILDRRVGNYEVPDGWLIWAAGNRKSDRAAVFDMPSALANRFIHLEVEPDIDSFKAWGLTNAVSERILAFLSFRPALLHKIDPQRPAWPSPRAWQMAHALHGAGLSIAPAVGEPTAAEFDAFAALYEALPDLEPILAGNGANVVFPEEASARYAVVLGLVVRADNAAKTVKALGWLIARAGSEWVQLFVLDAFRRLRERGLFGELPKLAATDPAIKTFLAENRDLIFTTA